MTIKESIIRKSIKFLEKKIAKTNAKIAFDPYDEFVAFCIEINDFFEKNNGKKLSEVVDEANLLLQKKAQIEKKVEAYNKMDKSKMYDKLHELEWELRNLKSELYFLEINNIRG